MDAWPNGSSTNLNTELTSIITGPDKNKYTLSSGLGTRVPIVVIDHSNSTGSDSSHGGFFLRNQSEFPDNLMGFQTRSFNTKGGLSFVQRTPNLRLSRMFLTSDDGVGANSRGNLFVGFTGSELESNTATYQSLGGTLTQLYVKSGIMFPDVGGLGGFIISQGNLGIYHGTDQRILFSPVGGDSNMRIDLRPLGTSTRSSINIFNASSGTGGNLLLRSDASEGGSIVVSQGMDMNITVGSENKRWVVFAGRDSITPTEVPRFRVDARNYYEHSSPIIHQPNINIFSSGVYTQANPGNWTTVKMVWQRCGNVVTCSGVAAGYIGPNALVIYPIKGLGDVTFASGVWVNSGTGGSDQGVITTFISGGPTFAILPVTYFDTTTLIRFTFSYVIN